MTLACEPTGHRWKVVNELATATAIDLVCVQPLLVHRAREAEDFAQDKSDDRTRCWSPGWPPSCMSTFPSVPIRPRPGCGTSVFAASSGSSTWALHVSSCLTC